MVVEDLGLKGFSCFDLFTYVATCLIFGVFALEDVPGCLANELFGMYPGDLVECLGWPRSRGYRDR